MSSVEQLELPQRIIVDFSRAIDPLQAVLVLSKQSLCELLTQALVCFFDPPTGFDPFAPHYVPIVDYSRLSDYARRHVSAFEIQGLQAHFADFYREIATKMGELRFQLCIQHFGGIPYVFESMQAANRVVLKHIRLDQEYSWQPTTLAISS